ncbi:MAG: pyroglutamyl-peptidase I family protein [Candidatus Hodarchaeales archaeon]
MITLLLTGFEPFGGHSVNPSEMIAKDLNNVEFSNIRVVGKTISLRFNKIKQEITGLIDAYEPEIVLNLGQASCSAISIEKVAINLANTNNLPYNCGSKPEDEILEPSGPAAYFSTLPVKNLVQHLNDNQIPCYISYSAGTFGCNQIMYHSLHHVSTQEKTPPCRVGFIHLPLLPEQVVFNPISSSMDYNRMKKSISLILSKLGEMKSSGDL